MEGKKKEKGRMKEKRGNEERGEKEDIGKEDIWTQDGKKTREKLSNNTFWGATVALITQDNASYTGHK